MKIKDLLKQQKYDEAIKYAVSQTKTFDIAFEDVEKQYDTLKHKVFDPTLRKDKLVLKPKLDNNGNQKKDSNDNPIFIKVLEPVVRVGLPFPQIIVDRRIGFLLGNPIELELKDYTGETPSVVYAAVRVIWDDNKLDYRNGEIAERLMSEREVAEIWYLAQDDEFWKRKTKAVGKTMSSSARVKMQIVSPKLGDKLYPVFDEFGDMVAFFRLYKISLNGKETEMVDAFTDEIIVTLKKTDGVWAPYFREGEKEEIQNFFKAIPVSYYRQEHTEWYNVQSMIERKETSMSNIGDENDYFGKPILFMKGTITGMANKTDGGKVLQGTDTSSAQFLSWEHAPESIKMEFEELESGIYKFSQTPDISFESVKGIGTVSGIALKLLFIDAHMAARKKERTFGEGVQRRINILKRAIGNIIDAGSKTESDEITISPKFTPFMPEDVKEAVEVLVIAKEGGILSTKSAVEKNPLVSNYENELIDIEEELDEQAIRMSAGASLKNEDL